MKSHLRTADDHDTGISAFPRHPVSRLDQARAGMCSVEEAVDEVQFRTLYGLKQGFPAWHKSRAL